MAQLFEWDEEKADINFKKHGILFETFLPALQQQEKGRYIMVTFELDSAAALTGREKKLLAEAKKLPVIYDEDSPELTDDMEKAFLAARKAKPFHGEPLTLYVSAKTIEKAKSMGEDYMVILGKLLDKAVAEYRAIS